MDPFDPTLAQSRTDVVSMRNVVDPLANVPHAPHRIEMYRQAMSSGARFPPISVVRAWRWYLVADGHKRLSAYRSTGAASICVEVWSWRRWLQDQGRQARNHARKNGQVLRLSVTDPRAAARLAGSTLAHWHRVGRSLLGGSAR